MFDTLGDWLAESLIFLLTLIDWLTDWLTHSLTDCLVHTLTDCRMSDFLSPTLTDCRLTDSHPDWLHTDCSDWLSGSHTYWLKTDWLTHWLTAYWLIPTLTECILTSTLTDWLHTASGQKELVKTWQVECIEQIFYMIDGRQKFTWSLPWELGTRVNVINQN